MEKLKSCPFCGAEATLVGKIYNDCFPIKRTAYVYCSECGIQTSIYIDNNKDDSHVKKAIASWNRRVCDECPDRQEARQTIAKYLAKEQRWIPCSERLPEDGTIALVCGKKGGIRVARVFIPYATGNWDGDPNTNWWTIVGTGKPFYPVAWMPLPEPWEGENNERA